MLLLVVTALLGWRLYDSLLQFNDENDLSKLQPVQGMKQKVAQDKPLPRIASTAGHSPAEFAIIPEKNAFSESRTREDKSDATAVVDSPPLTQKPVLVGISIMDNQKRASIIDPSSSAQGRNRRSQTKRIGDSYRGYTITDISPMYIVLESGTRKEIIPLHEGSKKPQTGKTAILSTRVVPFGGGTITGGTPVTVVGGGNPGAGRTAGLPTSGPGSTVVQPVPVLPAGVQQRTTQTNPTQTQPTPAQVPSTETDAQGRRIIRTPFGNIVRPNTP